MRRRGHTISVGRTVRATRAVLGLVLAVVLAGAQGVDHSHVSAPDALQCAICHWHGVDVSPAPPALERSGPVGAVVELPAPPAQPQAPAGRRAPPVRGPPSLI